MNYYPEPVRRLIEELIKLPGIGTKTAERLTFYLLKIPGVEIQNLARVLMDFENKIRYCTLCNNVTEIDPCRVCMDERRDKTTICVVEEPNDLIAIEKTQEYKGLYYVLLGALSPLEGIGPDDIKIKGLMERLREGIVKEVIIATNANVEGEATAMYLINILKPLNIRLTRLAHGLPAGSDLEYADEVTLCRAIEGRREIN